MDDEDQSGKREIRSSRFMTFKFRKPLNTSSGMPRGRSTVLWLSKMLQEMIECNNSSMPQQLTLWMTSRWLEMPAWSS